VEIYDTEEEQLEALKRWWKENGQATILGLVMGIAVILAWNFWQDHKKEQAGLASALYSELLLATDSNKLDSAEKLAERLQQQYPKTEYAAYSGLLLAKVKVQQGDLAKAQTILTSIASGSNKELGNIANIRLVRLMMANGQYEQGLKLINSIDPANSASYSGNYDELVGDLYVALDRIELARSSYQKALEIGYRSPLLQLKIDDLTAPEKDATPATETQK
jgi:predicted negative regulator of RcsB-dependent stress response